MENNLFKALSEKINKKEKVLKLMFNVTEKWGYTIKDFEILINEFYFKK